MSAANNSDYNSIARFYDLAAGWTLAGTRRELARQAAASGAKRVLDIGCGTGLQLMELERHGLYGVGVDNSKAMLSVARRRLYPEGGEAPGRLIFASGASLPFAADAFDLAVLSLVLHESAEAPASLLDEALRAAPRLLLLDWGMPERNLEYPMHLGAHFIERLAGKRHYAAYKDYLRQGALEGLMQRYGLAGGIRVAWRRQVFFNSMLLMLVERV